MRATGTGLPWQHGWKLLDGSSGLYALGNRIELDKVGGRETYTLPANYFIFHDETGAAIPRCMIYLARRVPSKRAGFADRLLGSYQVSTYDNGRLSGWLEVPKGPWVHLANVEEIRYLRPGVGPKYHPFKRSVRLEYCEEPEGWRLPLPAGCVVNYRGFVNPLPRGNRR
jgi:hypothetical protein